MEGTCSMIDCNRPVYGHSLCQMHHRRWRRHGDPAIILRPGTGGGRVRGLCSIPGCGEPHAARGWCVLHYERWKRQGDPNVKLKPGLPPGQGRAYHKPLLDRFNAKWAIDDAGCHIWIGKVNRTHGYAYITDDGKDRLAHRVAYELFVGPIPEGMHVDHLCNVRRCVNPAHLEAVTQQENNRRMKERM